MAANRTPGQMKFDFEDVDTTNRMPKLSPMRMYGKQEKLHTPYVFTEEAESDPRPWIPVASTRVAQIRYDDGTRQVNVIFADGTPWVYEDVPAGVFEAFSESPSKGRYINAVLDSFPYRRATPIETARW